MIWLVSAVLAMTPAEQRADVEMVRELIRVHPATDDPTVTETLDEALLGIAGATDMAPHLFYGRLKRVLASLNDGHFDAVMDGPPLDDFLGEARFLPYDVLVYEDDLYLDRRLHEPARVVSIDGMTGTEIIREMRLRVSSDSVTPSSGDHVIDRHFSDLYAYIWGFSDVYDVVLEPGPARPVRVPGVSYDDVPFIGASGPNTVRMEDDVLWITMNELMPGASWRPFWRGMKAGLKRADAVVLDLRDCGGGFAPTADAFLELFVDAPQSYRTQLRIGAHFGTTQPTDSMFRVMYAPDASGTWRPRPHLADTIEMTHVKPWRRAWTDRMVVVTGPGTFSKCSNVASALAELGEEVVVIGAETRGGARRLTAGHFEQRSLPNSGILLRTGLVESTMPESFGDLGRGVLPDRPVVDRPDTEEDEVETCARLLAMGADVLTACPLEAKD